MTFLKDSGYLTIRYLTTLISLSQDRKIMDIKNLIKSHIIRKNDIYQANLPNIEWYFESVYYSHDDVIIDYLSTNFSERLSFANTHNNLDHIFLMSSIFWYIFLRIIDTHDFYNDHILIIKSGKIFNFIIRDRTYFVLIYTGYDGKYSYYSNFRDQPIFRKSFEESTFMIANHLTGTIVVTCSYYQEENHENFSDNISEENSTTDKIFVKKCMIMPDLLFSEKWEKDKIFDFFKESHVSNIKYSISPIDNESLVISYSDKNNSGKITDFEKFIGFVWTHQCVVEDRGRFDNYRTFEEISDLNMDLPDNFTPSERIDTTDPNWHEMRKSLLEFWYMIHIIKIQIQALSGSIDAINTLNSQHLELQKDHSIMTLNDLIKIEKIYTIHLETITTLLKNSLT